MSSNIEPLSKFIEPAPGCRFLRLGWSAKRTFYACFYTQMNSKVGFQQRESCLNSTIVNDLIFLILGHLRSLNLDSFRVAENQLLSSFVYRQAVLELQKNRKWGRIRGSDVLELMRTNYGVDPSLRTVYDTLKRAELVWITGRSIHPKADLEVQDTFKKTSETKLLRHCPQE